MKNEAARHGRPATNDQLSPTLSAKPAVADLLEQPDALLSSSHLRELGLPRRAIDAIFKGCPVVVLPGYSRPLVRVRDYLALLEANTFRDDRVRVSR